MFNRRFAIWLLTVFLLIISWVGLTENEYMSYRETPITVVDKLQTHSKSGHPHFTILYRTDAGVLFDRPVSYGTFKTSDIKDRYNITVREFDVRQTAYKNVVFFIIPILFMSCFTSMVLLLPLFWWLGSDD
jgi:hypothetical protein